MPIQCKLCGSWRHSQQRCDASPEKQLAYKVRGIAINWMHAEIFGNGDYFSGRESAIKQCGEDLYDLVKPYFKEADELRPNKDVV